MSLDKTEDGNNYFCTSKVISVSDEGKMANKASCLGFNKRSDDGIRQERNVSLI
jgi:hypothetical protein